MNHDGLRKRGSDPMTEADRGKRATQAKAEQPVSRSAIVTKSGISGNGRSKVRVRCR